MLRALLEFELERNRGRIEAVHFQAIGSAGLGGFNVSGAESFDDGFERVLIATSLERRCDLPGAILFFEVDRGFACHLWTSENERYNFVAGGDGEGRFGRVCGGLFRFFLSAVPIE